MKKILVTLAIIALGMGVFRWLTPTPEYDSVAQATVIANTACSSAVDELDGSDFQETLMLTCKSDQSIHTIIRGDGNPVKGDEYDMPDIEMRNPDESKIEQMAALSCDEISSQLAEVKAKTSEADVVEMIWEAKRSLSNAKTDHKKIVLVCNMLSTKGAINFTDSGNGNGTKTPKEIVEELKAKEAIPDLTGVEVEIYGFAKTAPPQEELTYGQQAFVRDVWEAFFTAANTHPVFLDAASTEVEEKNNLPHVTPVTVPNIESSFSGKTVLRADELAFIGDTAKFVDPERAELELKDVGQYLKEDRSNTILVVGCTATGSDEVFCQELSDARAEAVKDALISYGAGKNQIETIGIGYWGDPYRVDDIDPLTGRQIESQAYKNRKVIIIDRSLPEAEIYLSGVR